MDIGHGSSNPNTEFPFFPLKQYHIYLLLLNIDRIILYLLKTLMTHNQRFGLKDSVQNSSLVLNGPIKKIQRRQSRKMLNLSRDRSACLLISLEKPQKQNSSLLDVTLQTQPSITSHASISLGQQLVGKNKVYSNDQQSINSVAQNISMDSKDKKKLSREPSAEGQVLKKKPFSRNNKANMNRSTPTGEIAQQPMRIPKCSQLEVLVLRSQKRDVELQNNLLKEKIRDIKEQNQFLYQQIERLNQMVLGEKSFNHGLADFNRDLSSKLSKCEQDLSRFKCHYKVKEGTEKKCEILEHVYLKAKHELENLLKANKAMELKNSSLTLKVSQLSKLIKNMKSETPVRGNTKHGSVKIKQNNRARSPGPIQVNGNLFSVNRKREEGFFELSPE